MAGGGEGCQTSQSNYSVGMSEQEKKWEYHDKSR